MGAHSVNEDSFVKHGGVCGVVQVVVGSSGPAEFRGQDDVPASRTGEVGQTVGDGIGPPLTVGLHVGHSSSMTATHRSDG